MRSPAAPFAWEFRRRHRWGLAALTLYLAVLGTLRLLVLEPGERVTLDHDWSFALVVVVPLGSTFMYFLAVFSFGHAGDLAARHSIYPARMFTLPLTNAALAGWPMLYGSAAMTVLWLVTRLLAVWPSGVDIPVVWPALQRDISGWNRLADRHGFIVVYPSGLDVGGIRDWRAIRPGKGLTKDVRFISDLIDDLEKAYNIDPTRIYTNGLSNGGGMAFVLSCTLSGRIAAVGMVAAAHYLPWSWSTDHRPVPMISFHGTADSIALYEGGTSWLGPEPSADVSERAANWARRNRCGPDTVESMVAAEVTPRDYVDCAGDAAVVLFTIHGGGHTWPGGGPLPEWFLGPTSSSVDATRQMWTFFREHRLREAQSAARAAQ
ncbi:MAG: hypothetical protein HYX75_18325 [Acidobacteria bacterium]|nr:hypothetical protein [Acidobacteriota bacterium]